MKPLSTDTQNFVRSNLIFLTLVSLSTSFLSLSTMVGKKNTSEFILPIFLQLLKDEESEVRISLFKKLNEITKVLGVDTLSHSIIPALTELGTDKNWRIRASSIEIISFFAKEIVSISTNIRVLNFWMKKYSKFWLIGSVTKYFQSGTSILLSISLY